MRGRGKSGLASDLIEYSPDAPNIRPFLRWAGSKRRLLKHILPFVPDHFEKYYEPFLGGGSLFFFLGPKRAEISDASLPLIETYRAVRRNPEAVLRFLGSMKPTRDNFDRMKRLRARTSHSEAGQFIFLNKSCWNGLYRVNSDGEFNVPYGMPKSDGVLDAANFRKCAAQLRRRGISIKHQDFGDIEQRVAKGDFVFFDPPYVTMHNLNGFVDWNENLFRWADQVRLSEMARRLAKKGANVVITNANHADVSALYPDFLHYSFTRSSTLASDRASRVQTKESIFCLGPAYKNPDVRARGRAENPRNRKRPAGKSKQHPEKRA